MAQRFRTSPDDDVLLGRLIAGEALSLGSQGMEKVGQVPVNRTVEGNDPNAESDCRDFAGLNTLNKVIYQKLKDGTYSFRAVGSPLFQSPPQPDVLEIAKQLLAGLRVDPKYALWFKQTEEGKCAPTFYNSKLSGQFKNMCFYDPVEGQCHAVYIK